MTGEEAQTAIAPPSEQPSPLDRVHASEVCPNCCAQMGACGFCHGKGIVRSSYVRRFYPLFVRLQAASARIKER